jgi:5-methylcytosine-specific restriction enzyme B
MSLFQQKIEGVPQFVSYFVPVRDALLHFGGQATARQVYDYISQHGGFTDDELRQSNQNGYPTFENRVAWARFYLTKAGWMFSPKRGVWALTEVGKHGELTEEQAVTLFKTAQTKFKGHEESQSAPENHVQPDDTQYWFVGAAWDEGDQLPRFLEQSVWQNGYDGKYADQVRDMKPGDRIAIKSAFVQKRDLPFDSRGRSVSVMRIKAIGTITRNHGDGRVVDVEWDQDFKLRDWYFYTYRSTVTRARVEDEGLAKRLVSFTFEGASQEYAYFMAQPYWRDRFQDSGNAAEVVTAAEEEFEELIEDELIEVVTYGVADILAEGCFLSEENLSRILKRWHEKKNLILQGPPGTGKTWLAKRLAKALIGQKSPSDDQLRVVQFHPSLSYEDFVRGYRPNADGRLALMDGIFLQVVEAARSQPDIEHVLIIEEINRGNPAQVLGEMLTLLESSKRSRADAMELAYRKSVGEKVYVPENLYVIGTMNIADRSLALVDLALRRRFAFITLGPCFNEAWMQWCDVKGLATEDIARIKAAMDALNVEVTADRALGPQFQIGHSYLTPMETVRDAKTWFADVVHTEIGPLLHEYWFDAPERAKQATQNLLIQA